jgi:hypothetical protein
MCRFVISMAVVALVLAGASVAGAAGICFDPWAPSAKPAVVVVKKNSKPSKGSCKTFSGWASWYSASPVTGSACLNSAGDTLRAGYTIHDVAYGGVPIFVSMVLPYPSLTSGYSWVRVEGQGFATSSSDAGAGLCFDLFDAMP